MKFINTLSQEALFAPKTMTQIVKEMNWCEKLYHHYGIAFWPVRRLYSRHNRYDIDWLIFHLSKHSWVNFSIRFNVVRCDYVGNGSWCGIELSINFLYIMFSIIIPLPYSFRKKINSLDLK